MDNLTNFGKDNIRFPISVLNRLKKQLSTIKFGNLSFGFVLARILRITVALFQHLWGVEKNELGLLTEALLLQFEMNSAQQL